MSTKLISPTLTLKMGSQALYNVIEFVWLGWQIFHQVVERVLLKVFVKGLKSFWGQEDFLFVQLFRRSHLSLMWRERTKKLGPFDFFSGVDL